MAERVYPASVAHVGVCFSWVVDHLIVIIPACSVLSVLKIIEVALGTAVSGYCCTCEYFYGTKY